MRHNPPPPTTRGRTLVKVNALTQAKLIRMLLDGKRSCRELADESGLHYVTVLAYTKYLHREGATHIAEYREDSQGRDAIKIYKIGVGKDAKRYKLTGAQRAARSRENRKAREMHVAMSAVCVLQRLPA